MLGAVQDSGALSVALLAGPGAGGSQQVEPFEHVQDSGCEARLAEGPAGPVAGHRFLCPARSQRLLELKRKEMMEFLVQNALFSCP